MKRLLIIICLLFPFLLGTGGDNAFSAGAAHKVYVVKVSGDVAPGMAAYLKRALENIPDGSNQTLVMEMDTFGGRVDSALMIVDLIVETAGKGKTVAFVTKKAISAGALIALACDALFMKPNTTIGDCAPIMVGSEGPQMLGEKFQSPLRAKFRSLARKNGYSEVLAESMVSEDKEVFRVTMTDGRILYMDALAYEEMDKNEKAVVAAKKTVVAKGELLTMDNTEAAELGFSKMTAGSIEDLLRGLGISDYEIIPMEQAWAETLLRVLETFAPLLMLIGLGAIYTEIKSPGFGAPGIVGIICLALFFMVQYSVGLADYTELLLFLLGLVLIGLEIFVIPGFGIAGVAGILCMIAGLVLSLQGFVLPDPSMPWQTELMVSNLIQVLGAVVAAFLVSLFLLRFVLPRMSTVVRGPYLGATLGNARAETSANSGARVGDRGLAATPLRPSGKMKAGPDIYDVVTEGDFLEKGTPVVISAVRGNVLVVSKEKPE
ncbi:MAG: NfeD family protein [Thermodesulfobacteriota bacterium]